jgi:hypothetical protein
MELRVVESRWGVSEQARKRTVLDFLTETRGWNFVTTGKILFNKAVYSVFRNSADPLALEPVSFLVAR